MRLSAEKKLELNLKCEKIVSALFPRTCPACGKLIKLTREDMSAMDPGSDNFMRRDPFICDECEVRFGQYRGLPRCMKCSKPLESSGDEFCRDCMSKERYFDRGIAALVHDEAAKKAIYDLKYSGLKINADMAAFEMLRVLWRTCPDLKKQDLLEVDAIIPVPLHRKRRRERGYNQAELIARRLEAFLEMAGHDPVPVDGNHLIRKSSTLRLKEMSGPERAVNLSGAFAVNGIAKYKRVLIIDDIFTTGATLNECAKTLRQTGCSVIYFITATIGS